MALNTSITETKPGVEEAAFDAVAAEYYDSSRHPTCWNFRIASRRLLRTWLRHYPPGKAMCDVGCGDSLLAELLSKGQRRVDQLILLDASPAMLAYSQKYSKLGARLQLADTEALPLDSGSCDLLVSSLGDPYNKAPFWNEAARVISRSGFVFFTSPSYEWAFAFRRNLPQDLHTRAEFELRDGSRVWLPSYICPESDQIQLIEQAGFRVLQKDQVTLEDLHGETLSPKLSVLKGRTARVVSGYVAIKTRE